MVLLLRPTHRTTAGAPFGFDDRPGRRIAPSRSRCAYPHQAGSQGDISKETSVAITREHVLQALATVPIDAGGDSLAASGRLSEVVVDEAGRVMFSIAIAPAEAAAMERVRQAAETAVKGLPDVKGAFVSLTADRPPPRTAPAPPAGRPAQAPAPRVQAIPGVKQVIAVASGKGGVGKSTVACNLALGLQGLGLRIGILDADIYGPSMPKLFGLHGKPRVLSGRILEPLDGYGVKVMSIGFLVEEETPMI